MYIFNLKIHGKNRKKLYTKEEVNLFALVCLDTRQVGYLLPHNMPSTVNIRADGLKGNYYDEKGISDYEKVMALSKTITNRSEIAYQVGIDVAIVCKMLKPNYKPFKTRARYFSDLLRIKEWFYGI